MLLVLCGFAPVLGFELRVAPGSATLAKITDPAQKQSGTTGFMLELSDTEIPASFGAPRSFKCGNWCFSVVVLSDVFDC